MSLSEKRTVAKFQSDSLKTQGLVCIFTDRRMDMTKSTQLIMLIIYVHIYFIKSPAFPSGHYKHRGKLNIPCSGYKKGCFVCEFALVVYTVNFVTEFMA